MAKHHVIYDGYYNAHSAAGSGSVLGQWHSDSARCELFLITRGKPDTWAQRLLRKLGPKWGLAILNGDGMVRIRRSPRGQK